MSEVIPHPTEWTRTQSRDKAAPRRFRQRVGVTYLPWPDRPDLALEGLMSVRGLLADFPTEESRLRPMLDLYEREVKALGIDAGTTAKEALAVFELASVGVWVAETPFGLPTQEEARASDVVLGGFMEPDYYTPKPHEMRPALVGGGLIGPTPWEKYLVQIEPPYHKRLELIRRLLQRDRRLQEETGSWASSHHFQFFDAGKPLHFTWRAWGDLLVALRGTGSYLDYYD